MIKLLLSRIFYTEENFFPLFIPWNFLFSNVRVLSVVIDSRRVVSAFQSWKFLDSPLLVEVADRRLTIQVFR